MNKQQQKVSSNGHLPAHSKAAEEALLGSLLIDEDAMLYIADTLMADDFYLAINRMVYEAILNRHLIAQPWDVLTLAEALDRSMEPSGGWAAYLIYLVTVVPTSIHIRQYADLIRGQAVRRRLLRAAETIATATMDDNGDVTAMLDLAESEIFAVRQDRPGRGISKPRQYTAAFLDRFERLRVNEREATGLPTGFLDLDRLLDGLQAPHQYVLAGRPAMGKSALAINIAAHLTLNRNKRVMLFSLEMGEYQIVNRIVSWVTRIDSRQKPGTYTNHQLAQLYEAVGELSDGHLFLDMTEGLSPGQLRAKALRQYAETGLDLIIVDHLHLMRPDRDMKRPDLEIGEISWSLANLAKQLNVPILTLAQLNRGVDARLNKRPALSDLRESGRIEENAFCVMFLYRDDYYNDMSELPNVAELIVAKNREGPTGMAELYWKPETATFRNLAQQENVF